MKHADFLAKHIGVGVLADCVQLVPVLQLNEAQSTAAE